MTTTTPICETAYVKSSAALGDKVSSYWNTRAEGYSLRTADELNGPRGAHWQERLLSNLRGVPSGGSVLDMFTPILRSRVFWIFVAFLVFIGLLDMFYDSFIVPSGFAISRINF